MSARQKTAPIAEPRRQLVRRIEQLAHRHSPWNVFSDFVELSAISISNAVDLVHAEQREARYMEIVKRYTSEELAAFPEMLAALVDALECGFDDVLGRVFHDLELHNKYHGQLFSPYHLCEMMARVTIGDEVKQTIATRGYVTLQEPACGSGAMVIAAAQVLKDQDLNYQQCLHATLIDVDAKCVHMAYVQLSLLHVPAIVVLGNTLALEEREHWRTPAHCMGGWEWRLRRRHVQEPEVQADEVEQIAVPFDEPFDAEAGQLVLL